MSNLEKDLAEVVGLIDDAATLKSASPKAILFIHHHHAEIAQNAKDVRRLKALKRAMREIHIPAHSIFALYGGGWIDALAAIKTRADEIMRDGTPEKAE